MNQPDYSDTLYAARCIAEYAVSEGIMQERPECRPVYHHIGAVLADSILQAGLNYAKVVKPRIIYILENFPHALTISDLLKVIETEGSAKFLQWNHYEKVSRFDALLSFIAESNIENTSELNKALLDNGFRSEIRGLKGIGPKTVDYMACLVGVDCVAVDRHIKSFATLAGLQNHGYEYLLEVFSFAADLMSVPRREFDANIWRYQVNNSERQLSLDFVR